MCWCDLEATFAGLQAGDPLKLEAAAPHQHFTKPPPHFTEASLVKSLEELGIGRPSTYASIIAVLQACLPWNTSWPYM